MNKIFVKIDGDINSSFTIFYAPKDMSEGKCLENGYKELIDNKPKNKKDYIIVLDHIDEDDTTYTYVYKYKKIQEIEKRYIVSKYKLIAKLMKAGLWTQVKQMLEDNNLLDLFNAAQVLDSEDEFFKQGIQMAKTALDMTDKQIQQFLEEVAE